VKQGHKIGHARSLHHLAARFVLTALRDRVARAQLLRGVAMADGDGARRAPCVANPAFPTARLTPRAAQARRGGGRGLQRRSALPAGAGVRAVPGQPALRQLCAPAAPQTRTPRRASARAHAALPARRADLAQNRLLSEPAMVAYLAYLQYWQRPEYARFLQYPAALAQLQLLQAPEYRAAMAAPEATEHVWRQQFYAWQHAGKALWAAQPPPWAGLPPPPPDAPPAEPPAAAVAS
jgi:hypothetical protein